MCGSPLFSKEDMCYENVRIARGFVHCRIKFFPNNLPPSLINACLKSKQAYDCCSFFNSKSLGRINMAQIAVDVVLIPSDRITNMAIEANRELLKKYPQKIILDREKCLPHISLAMGCIDRRKITEIEIILRKIAEDLSIRFLNIVNVHTHTNIAGEKVSVLQVEKTNRLQSLHEKVMTSMKPYFRYDVTADMLLSDGIVGESSLQWIKNYPAESGYGNFSPHITLGYGEIRLEIFPVRFNVSKIALCHLGNHCTCRKVLAAAELTA